MAGHKLHECRLGGGSYWAPHNGTGKVHGLEAAPLFMQAGDDTWVAVLPEDTLHGNGHILGLGTSTSPTTNVLQEVLLRLWVVHGIELNAKHTTLSTADNSQSPNSHTLPHSEHSQYLHKFWFAGPMWEGQCRRGSTKNKPPNKSGLAIDDEQPHSLQTEQPHALQTANTPTPTSMEMALSNCTAEQLALLSSRSALLERAATLNDATPVCQQSSKKTCNVFETTHIKCDCTASLKIQRIVLFDPTNGIPAHLVTLNGVHTCTTNKSLNAMRPKYPSVALNLAAEWATPWAMSGTDSGDVVATLITERFASLIEGLKYQPHPRLSTCLSPSFRDITPVVVAARKRAGEARRTSQLQITDATINQVVHDIATSTGGRVRVITPKFLELESEPTIGIEGHKPNLPIELELDERVDDTVDKLVTAAISANMSAELLSAAVVDTDDESIMATRHTPPPCLAHTLGDLIRHSLTITLCNHHLPAPHGSITSWSLAWSPHEGLLMAPTWSPHGTHMKANQQTETQSIACGHRYTRPADQTNKMVKTTKCIAHIMRMSPSHSLIRSNCTHVSVCHREPKKKKTTRKAKNVALQQMQLAGFPFMMLLMSQIGIDMLTRFGSVVFMDSTHNTNTLGIPLFTFAVRLASGNFMWAAFILSALQSTQSVVTALLLLKKSAPDWKPLVTMNATPISLTHSLWIHICSASHVLICAFVPTLSHTCVIVDVGLHAGL